MKTVYQQGFRGNGFFMGGSRLGQLDWLPSLIQSGTQGYTSYEQQQIAEDQRKAAEAAKAAAAANQQAAITNAMTAQSQQNILGLSPGVFWVGLLGIGALVAVLVVKASKN